jgi:hypothetical protein
LQQQIDPRGLAMMSQAAAPLQTAATEEVPREGCPLVSAARRLLSSCRLQRRGETVMTRERAAGIRFRLQLARQAAARGAFGAARQALRQLSASDFAGGPAVAADHVAVLNDHRATDDQVREAVSALVGLRAGGLR